MVVISVSITQSEEQVVSGIPRTVTLTTNIPANIFYTLDGSVPTLFSAMYVDPITMPTDKLIVILNVFASNGTDVSPIISETYQTDMVSGDARLPRSSVDVPPGTNMPELYPFGTNPIQPMGTYLNPADSGVTVYNPALPATATAFDADGYQTAYTNQPYNLINYNIVYTTTNAEGETGPNIGNLPKNKIQPEVPPPEETQLFSNMFDPRALVIFQNFADEDPDMPPQVNRQFFTLQNDSKVRDGNAYFSRAIDGPPPSGSLVRSHYNPRTNEITYYYFDSWNNRWIISTTPYVPNGTWDGNISTKFMGHGGSARVFEWIPFQRRAIF